MNLDNHKIDEAVLALLLLGLHDEVRAWKGFDWDAMDRLHERGLISNPRSAAKSIVFTEEGLRKAERALARLFTRGLESQPGVARAPSVHGYAIVRADLPLSENSIRNSITVKEIVSDQATAEAEVTRLNAVNAEKDRTYFWQATRVFPPGYSAGNRSGEKA
jgi:hypothetical protein